MVFVCNEQSEWEILFWSSDQNKQDIEVWFNTLTKDEFKAVAKEMKLLALCGHSLKLPHSRSLKRGNDI